jgi:uncharacterized membrane protein YozB (DUF420 family)
MGNILEIILFKFFWLIAIIAMILNGIILKLRIKPHVESHPESRATCMKILAGFVILFNIPWLVMGFSILIRKVDNIWYFFKPAMLNNFVLFGSATASDKRRSAGTRSPVPSNTRSPGTR